ncbi:MAG: fumarate hydratase C-terminal domain-containing protein [Candidatus Omnitrophica bacterium]|nr:fumarate hydratase C-terminal domain-containing protein [Candidatus Omnitrophota bacterium]
MKNALKICTPLDTDVIKKLKAGQFVFISGTIYTARDQAHLRLAGLIKSGKKLPLVLKNQIIYYTGPTPAGKGRPVGSCGPTTSSRMDEFTPSLLDAGVKVLIGKGRRSQEVVRSLKKNKGVYLMAPAGCGAYLSERVKKAKLLTFGDLGPEAIYKLEVENFPAVVAIDSRGRKITA